MRSLFELMKAEKLTSLTIDYNYKKDVFLLRAEREWDETVDFSLYTSEFSERRLFMQDTVCLGTEEIFKISESRGALAYLNEILQLIRQGRHEAIRLYYYEKYDAKFMCFEHNTARGRRNRCHAVTCGGIRRHPAEKEEKEVFIDGLNLGRAMTFKNFAANIPFGGCKIILQTREMDLKNRDLMGFVAFATERVRAVTAPDMNLPAELSDAMEDTGLSAQFVGGKKSTTGTTGKPTAYGVFLSLKEALRFKEGSPELCGKKVLLIGLGAVGWNMGEYLLTEDAVLYVADIDEAKVNQFVKLHPKHNIRKVPIKDIFTAEVDILSPCAAGGLITEENIPRLKCKYIWGSANNQLKASSQAEELRLAKEIADRGILYQADWWHNPAGVICMAEEYLNNGTEESLMRRVEETVPQATRENLEYAKKAGITPSASCYKQCEEAIYRDSIKKEERQRQDGRKNGSNV